MKLQILIIVGLLCLPILAEQNRINPAKSTKKKSSLGWVSFGAYPHQVHLNHSKTGTHCGGSIINSFLILTAAHCFLSNKDPINVDMITVVAGQHNLHKTTAWEQLVRIQQVFPHENYTTDTPENDIALLVLKDELHFTNHVQPINLPFLGVPPNDDGVSTGWGKKSFRETKGSVVLHGLNISILDPIRCNKKIESTLNKNFPNNTIQMKRIVCALASESTIAVSKRSNCDGDSGGPLTCKSGNISFLCGVSSFAGGTCGLDGTPGIYMNVAEYFNWILETKEKIMLAYRCPDGFFRCHNDHCVNSAHLVDGNNDCGDWSDENETLSQDFKMTNFNKWENKFEDEMKKCFHSPSDPKRYKYVPTDDDDVYCESEYRVQLWVDDRGNKSKRCSGAILSSFLILTTAQCVHKYGRNDSSLEKITIIAGTNESGAEQKVKVQQIVLHQNFTQNIPEDNIAILVLKKELNLTVNIRPIKIPHISYSHNSNFSWRLLIRNFMKGPNLTEGINPSVLEKLQCGPNILKRKFFRERVRQNHTITLENLLCDNKRGNESRTVKCEKDSGAPLICYARGKPFLCGIHSCGFPGIFLNVAKYYAWIGNATKYISTIHNYCPEGFFRCFNGHCINSSHLCDGAPDCKRDEDNADEIPALCKMFKKTTFKIKEFDDEGRLHKCFHSLANQEKFKFIPKEFVCNGNVDCANRSEEVNCTKCNSDDAFHCSNRNCIKAKDRCDGFDHCGDGSDEFNCTSCNQSAFHCNISQQCLLEKTQKVCDGKKDCDEGEDEVDCFKCGNDQVIKPELVCDGEKNCSEGEDEQNCLTENTRNAVNTTDPEYYE